MYEHFVRYLPPRSIWRPLCPLPLYLLAVAGSKDIHPPNQLGRGIGQTKPLLFQVYSICTLLLCQSLFLYFGKWANFATCVAIGCRERAPPRTGLPTRLSSPFIVTPRKRYCLYGEHKTTHGGEFRFIHSVAGRHDLARRRGQWYGSVEPEKG
jgi:hypothetical protein